VVRAFEMANHSGLCRVYLTLTSLIILCAARSLILLSLSVHKGGKFTMIYRKKRWLHSSPLRGGMLNLSDFTKSKTNRLSQPTIQINHMHRKFNLEQPVRIGISQKMQSTSDRFAIRRAEKWISDFNFNVLLDVT